MSVTFSPLLDRLIQSLSYLPGVGPKTAQRMAFHLLSRAREKGERLAQILQTAIAEISHCKRCRTFSEHPLCRYCDDPRRDETQLCVVESPADIVAIEQTATYRGYYFVLLGHLSPLDGIGPEHLGLSQFLALLKSQSNIQEVILATNPTVEGEATAHYIAEILKPFPHIRITRIAHGVPLGGELGQVGAGTLARALLQRSFLINESN